MVSLVPYNVTVVGCVSPPNLVGIAVVVIKRRLYRVKDYGVSRHARHGQPRGTRTTHPHGRRNGPKPRPHGPCRKRRAATRRRQLPAPSTHAKCALPTKTSRPQQQPAPKARPSRTRSSKLRRHSATARAATSASADLRARSAHQFDRAAKRGRHSLRSAASLARTRAT